MLEKIEIISEVVDLITDGLLSIVQFLAIGLSIFVWFNLDGIQHQTKEETVLHCIFLVVVAMFIALVRIKMTLDKNSKIIK